MRYLDDSVNYSKPKGYETVRYPRTGLVATEDDREATMSHNAAFLDHEMCVKLLNSNIKNWLVAAKHSVAFMYHQCLEIPTYTLFSNTTSASDYNEHHVDDIPIIPLERPHNHIHLATGGFQLTGNDTHPYSSFSNGDMGENETASFDPIFYFHHCWIDRVFWKW